MKFCKRRRAVYKEANQPERTADYVTLEDIKEFHGDAFAKQWLVFAGIGNLKLNTFNEHEGYYASDYEYYARRTQQYVHPAN